MKISVNWIKDYVDLSGVDIKDLWYRFTMSTAEIEDYTIIGDDINKVVVGKVVKVEKHPSSEKLNIAYVDVGSEVLQSVCGAPNLKEGIYVPFAKVGGSIKKVDCVAKTTLQGIESNGILCSPAEIGISDKHEGIFILEGDYKSGTDIKEIMDIDDFIIEIDNKSLTNRPDLWGHYGIAREIAAILDRPLKSLDIAVINDNVSLPYIDIKLDEKDKDKCRRYSCIAFSNFKTKYTPINMQIRLYYCGMRSISPLVDLTNYVMLDIGQPMHAYDKKLIDKIEVKTFENEIKLTTIDGVERVIPKEVLTICNQSEPMTIAGVMGGQDYEVSEDTSEIILEAASFDGVTIRKGAIKIGIRTEASARFEKILDPNLTIMAIQRFYMILKDIQDDIIISSKLSDLYSKPFEAINIEIEKEYIDKYIGNVLDTELIVKILKSLEFKVIHQSDMFRIEVPSFRATKDITSKIDIIEEISRIYGYDNIVPKSLDIKLKELNYNDERIFEHSIRDILSERFNMNEVNSYIWYNNNFNNSVGIGKIGSLQLLDPSIVNNKTLRNSLVPTFLEIAEYNMKYYDEFSIYELGSVFELQDIKAKCSQHKNICILLSSKAKSETEQFFELKGISTYLLKKLKNIDITYNDTKVNNSEFSWIHPIIGQQINYKDKELGYITVIHPSIKQKINKKLNITVLEINLETLNSIENNPVIYEEPSKYPSVKVDFNLLIDKDIKFEEIDSYIDSFKSDILLKHDFVDLYTGKGIPDDKKSMTFSFTLGSKNRTLSSDEVNNTSKEFLLYMKERNFVLR